MRTFLNIIICGHNEILRRHSVNKVKEKYNKKISTYDCSNFKEKLKLILLPNKNMIKLIDNFDVLTKLQLKIILQKSGLANILVTRLSNDEIYQLFCKRNCIELYIQFFPYLLDVDNIKKSTKKFLIVKNGLFEYLFE